MPPSNPTSIPTKPMIEQNTDGVMQLMARDVVKYLSPEYGFVIIVFPFNGKHASSYISNTKRTDMIRALRVQADMLEQKKVIITPEETVKQ